MRTTMLLLGLLFSSILFGLTEVQVERYQPKIEYGSKIFVPMQYGKFDASTIPALKKVNSDDILKIEVVCTDHPKGINLDVLNTNRISQLDTLIPNFNTSTTHISTIRQMACETREEAETLFHGLVITYRPEPTKEAMEKELGKIDELLKGEKIPAMTTDNSDSTEIESIVIEEAIALHSFEKVIAESDYIHGATAMSAPSATSKLYPGLSSEASKGYYQLNYQRDSTFFKILKRNSDWKNMMITVDVTGSMYPYTAQILAWLQLNTKDDLIKQFVFFNDGDRTPDRRKIIGKTGGIYTGDFTDYTKVKSLISKAMRNGGGGDAPENNIEALLEGLKSCENCNDIIMVADNWAPIKDISLLKELNRPVKVVLCGVWGGMNVDYLNLARSTGGSVHTIEDDLTELAKLNEGATVELGGQLYKIKDGRFIGVRKI